MTFKEDIENDISEVFLDSDEFGNTHSFNGVDYTVIVDNDLLDQKKIANADLYQAEILIHISAADIDKPSPEQYVTFDSVDYKVLEANENDGMYTIILYRNAY
jgi:hypothetical protein